ncbi:MAG: UDP-N-acetylmuramoyl-tripeptide--D-alanyl-D-alanine ligase, partial [Defluviitaleaceae bacterium]|nr:UDP-N-acetylmuramoyl-tripeptide--D-alanyl-D-alanine ligase [Defluviitaleaceae bacterium]
KTVAITGSSGKTTTKELIAGVVSQKYETLKTQGNLNNEIGVPKMIFRLEERHEILILEMGMNHFGEMHNLSVCARPNMAVITNVGFAHMENLGSREGILKAKSEIFDGMDGEAPAILNGDDEYLRTLAGKRQNIVWYGLSKCNDFYAERIENDGLSTRCRLLSPKYGLDIDVTIPSPGSHMVLNALAAAAVGSVLGVPPDAIKRGIEAFTPTENRMEITKTGEYTIINDAYNANPSSMKAALDVLAAQDGYKTAILGDMLELGAMSAELHEEIGAYAAEKGVDRLIAVGSDGAARLMYEEFRKHMDAEQAASYYNGAYLDDTLDKLLEDVDPGAVLVKASRGMALERVVKKIKENLAQNLADNGP